MRVLAIILSILLPAFAEAATWNVVQIDKRRYVPISDVAGFYKMVQSGKGEKSFRLTGTNRVIEGRAGASEVKVNGVKYVTCFPLQTRGGAVYVSAMDVSKVIEPVMRPGKIQGAKPIKTIVLDAGHGGHDSGAVGALGREKQYTLDVVMRARALLLQAGFQVKMTRSTDLFIPLEDRAAYANRFPDALFVSVHFNKSNTGGGTGIETYALAPRGVPSMDEENLRYSDFKLHPGNACDAQNIALAAAMHSALCRRLPLSDRGVKRARFVVIKNVRVPGVLIEGGFLSNAYDARLIATAEYRQRIAQSILDAALAYTRAVTGAAPEPSAVIRVDPGDAAPVGSRTSVDDVASKVNVGNTPP
jgi:N-acetylmuramoyl-L-alanine amidase